MRKILACVLMATLGAGSVFAFDACNPCPPAPCPPKMKWVEVCETVQVEVPVVTYVDVPCEVKVKKMVPCEQEVDAYETKWINETKMVPVKRRVYEDEEYTVMVTKNECRTETRVRKVPQYVCETVEKQVWETVCEEVCDPCTGEIRVVKNKVCKTVPVEVRRKIYVEEPYEVQVLCKVKVPEVRTRRVCRVIEEMEEVCVPKCVKVPVKKTVTVMKPTYETQTVMRKQKVCTTQTVEKQVVRKVQVPCDPVPAC